MKIEEIIKEITTKEKYITSQLIALRKYKHLEIVQKYIKEALDYEFCTPYQKYIIEKYFYGNKNAKKAKKNSLEKMFHMSLR